MPGTVLWDFSEISPDGCTGDPTLGDRERGQVWIERVLGFGDAYITEYDRNTARAQKENETR